MGIKEICSTIQTAIDNCIRVPFASIAGLIMICSLIKRPGLSCILSTSNIINAVNCAGLYTDDMPDGQPNKMNAFIKANVCEVFRAIREDANAQTAFGPGSIMTLGEGGNAGGPVVVTSHIINYAKGVTQIS